MKCIFDILCTVITLVNNETNFRYDKIFFPNLYNRYFAFFEKLFYCYACRVKNIGKNICAFLFL